LPQSIAVVSGGMTRGTVNIVVQGLTGTAVEAIGTVTAELQSSRSAAHVSVLLERHCDAMGQCECQPLDCSSACGRLDDGCGGQRDCGSCGAAQSCMNNRCVSTSCVPHTCADAGVTCGKVTDGCNGTLDCGACDAGPTCGDGGCACAPRTCEDAGVDCGQLLNGCGGTLDCGGCDAGTCGGGGTNRCGSGMCKPKQTCDAGLNCGAISDGCSALISCGGCDAGQSCNANVCCAPITACPAGKHCGTVPNGCGGTFDCGGCDGGSCAANQCVACTPLTACPPGACGTWSDGCGGTLSCASCSNTQSCRPIADGGSFCSCPAPSTACGADCVVLSNNSLNCGACGHACPGGQVCTAGLCPCVNAASNTDGHCCPPGWTFELDFTGGGPLCYLGPRGDGMLSDAIAACQASTLSGYGQSVSAVGFGLSQAPGAAVPANACGAFWEGATSTAVLLAGNGLSVVSQCDPACQTPHCICGGQCACDPARIGCTQSAYCVMEPLAPSVDGACTADSQCQPGFRCSNGACAAAGHACVTTGDCPTGMCVSRGIAITGTCQ
jgi:hypothetical protein